MRYGARAPGGHPLPVLIEHGSGHGVLIRVSVAGGLSWLCGHVPNVAAAADAGRDLPREA